MSVDAEVEARLLDMQALICQALADPKRLRIVYLLAERECSVGELAQLLGASMANVSQHLSVLRARGLVWSRREGSSVLYGLAYPEIAQACQSVRAVLLRQLDQGSRMIQSPAQGG